MTAIAGLHLAPGATAEPRRIEAMLAAMVARAPGLEGTFLDGPVALGRAKRCVEPGASPAAEPRTLASHGLTIVADLRLDARAELTRALGLTAPADDAELALAAYARFGTEFPAHLVGDFAIALWDARERRLVLARDVFGARPLRYVHDGARLAFASDTAALRASGLPLGGPDRVRVGDFLLGGVFEAADASSTFLTRVKRLPPAHTLVFERGRVTLRRYFRFFVPPRPLVRSEGEATEAFRATLEDVVGDRIRGDARVGSMLSGGLDSSSIVAVARDRRARAGGPAFPTVSVVSTDRGVASEVGAIEAMISAGGLAPVRVSAEDLAAEAPVVRDFLARTDDPFDANVLCVPLLAFRAAREHGIDVLLDGVDGDLVASHGLETVRYALEDGSPRRAWREARAHAAFLGLGSARLFFGRGVLQWAWRAGRVRLPTAVLEARDLALRRALVRSSLAASPIDPELTAELDPLERARAQFPAVEDMARVGSVADDHVRALEWAMIPAALERYGRAAAHASVEASHPYLDRRLVELCLGTRWDLLGVGGAPKLAVRRALASRLPPAVLAPRWDPNLSWVVRPRLLRLLSPWCLDILSMGPRVALGYVRPESFDRAQQALRAGRMNVGDAVWQLVTIVCWLDRQRGS